METVAATEVTALKAFATAVDAAALGAKDLGGVAMAARRRASAAGCATSKSPDSDLERFGGRLPCSKSGKKRCRALIVDADAEAARSPS